jgi:hypothetical protein
MVFAAFRDCWGLSAPRLPGRAGAGRLGLRLLQDLRRSLLEPPRQLRPQPATATQPPVDPGVTRSRR